MKKIEFIGIVVIASSVAVSATMFYLDKISRYDDPASLSELSKNIAYNLSRDMAIAPVISSPYPVVASSSVKIISAVSPEIIKLNVPYYKQEYEKSCEAASLRMVLGYYGIKTNDWDILQVIGYNPRGRDFTGNVWDDPTEMFVGYVEAGKIGYGVYAEPVAKAAKSFGHEADVYKNVSPQFLTEQILNGHPVIAWGYYPYATFVKYTWKTEAGKDIFGYRGEHTRVIYGFVGEADSPEGFYIHDPNFVNGGAEQYWSTEKLMENMNIMGELSNQAVVVR